MTSLGPSRLWATALLAVSALANPIRRNDNTTTAASRYYNGSCTADTISIRKEWRSMASSEQQSYLDAVTCLMNAPAQTSIQGVTNRFSDLQGLHRSKTNATVDGVYVGDIIHMVGQFFPWHRWFIAAEEHMLRTECNYTGAIPWWDEAKDADAGDFFQSSMWRADAFGGNGTTDGGLDYCVVDGAFANYTVHMGPLLEDTSYCMGRQWDNDYGVTYCNSEVVANCSAYTTYLDFMECMIYPHVLGHEAVGGVNGVMSDIDNSPADPTFFLHHTYLDRVWWQWQAANSTERMFDVLGNAYNVSYLAEIGYSGTAINGTAQTTLDYVLNVADILPDIAIYDVMNIQGGTLCYDYAY